MGLPADCSTTSLHPVRCVGGEVGGWWYVGEGWGEWMCGRGEGVRCVDVLEGRGQAKWVCGRGEGTG